MTARRLVLFTLALGLSLGARPAAGQVLQGVLIDELRGGVVPGAFLSLIDEADVVHDTVTSDHRGQFVLTAPAAGVYVVGVQREGYAAMLSDGVRLETGETTAYTLEVAPTSVRNLEQIAETMDRNERLRNGVVELCRGRMNPVDGGLLLGVVRERRSQEAVSGAVVRFGVTTGEGQGGGEFEVASAVTDRHGTYLFCFVPKGESVRVTVMADGFEPASQEVEIRSGTISWYDFRLRRGGND